MDERSEIVVPGFLFVYQISSKDDSVEFPRLISLACLIGVTEVAGRTFIQEERDPRKGKIRIGVEVRETIFEIMRQLQAQRKL